MSGTINLATYASQIVLNDEGLQSGLQSADKQIKKKTDGISKYLKVGLAGAMASVASAGGTMFGVAKNVSGVADEIDKTSMKLGVSTDALQELRFASGQTGVAQNQLEKGLGRLNQRMGLAAEGNDKYSDALTKLGVDMEGVRDGTVSTDEAFMQSIDTLNGMSNSQEQAALASELFGTKLSRDLMPMIQAGALSVDDLRGKAHELGGVMSGESIDAGALFADSLDEITTMLGGMKNEIGAQLLPVIQTFLEWIMEYMPQIQATFSFAFEIMETLVTNFIGSIGKLIDWVKNWYDDNQETVNAIKNTFVDIFGQIQEAISAFINLAMQYWDTFGEYYMTQAKTIFNTIKEVIKGAVDIIQGILDTFIGLATGDWEKFTSGLEQIWSGLWEGIKSIINGAWRLVSQPFKSLYKKIKGWFTGLVSDALQWGQNIVEGLWDGIKGSITWINGKIEEFAGGVANAFKNFFGIESPSKLMAEYGKYIDEGLATGIDANRHLALNSIGSLASEMLDEAKSAVDRVGDIISNVRKKNKNLNSDTHYTSGANIGMKKGKGIGSEAYKRANPDMPAWLGGGGGDPKYKYHDGGWVGNMYKNLQHDEVPAILQQGEYVLSRKMVRDIANSTSSQRNNNGLGNTISNQYDIHLNVEGNLDSSVLPKVKKMIDSSIKKSQEHQVNQLKKNGIARPLKI